VAGLKACATCFAFQAGGRPEGLRYVVRVSGRWQA